MEKQKIAPELEKYSIKPGFFKKIQLKILNFYKFVKNNKELKKELTSFLSIFFGIGIYGVIGAGAGSLLGFSFNLESILGFGCALWLLENKFIEFTSRIFSSIKLIVVNK